MNVKSQKELGAKAFYAAVGAPVLAGRRLLDYRKKLATYGDKMSERAQARFDEAATEGEKVAKQLQNRKVIEDLQSRVDFEKVQERVEHFRDQLESALQNWRESIAPEGKEEKKPAEKKPAAKKTVAKKTAAKKTPAKTAAARKTAVKKPVAKKTPAKTVAAKKPAKKAPATKASPKKAPVKAGAK